MSDSCRHFLVAGRVQGVFYRASAEATAIRLGLSGWVRNLADGRVELVACGDEAILEELERWLRQGPPHARVDAVMVSAANNDEVVRAGFVVRYD